MITTAAITVAALIGPFNGTFSNFGLMAHIVRKSTSSRFDQTASRLAAHIRFDPNGSGAKTSIKMKAKKRAVKNWGRAGGTGGLLDDGRNKAGNGI